MTREISEQWTPIDSLDGKYLISNFGKIKINYNGKRVNRNGQIKKQFITKTGYCVSTFQLNGRYYRKYVHRLVADAFIPTNDKNLHINHKDGNKENNTVENLEWVTRSENQIHAYKNGLIIPRLRGKLGEDSINPKFTNSQADEIRQSYVNKVPIKELVKKYNCHKSTIYRIIQNKTYSNISATSLNLIQEKAEYAGQAAYVVAGREFQIVDGIVSLVYPPVPEPILEEPTPVE